VILSQPKSPKKPEDSEPVKESSQPARLRGANVEEARKTPSRLGG